MAKKQGIKIAEPEEESQDVPDEEPARVIDEDESDDAPESNGGSISKAQAVRNALAEGLDKPGDIADFAKKRYGLDIPKQQVSAYKTQAKARLKKDGGEEPAAAPEEVADDQAGASKTDLIREAVEAGYEKPALGVAYIKKQHGIEIDAKYYSIVKGKLAKAEDQPVSTPTAPASQQAAATPSKTTPSPSNGSTGALPGSLFDDLKQLRSLKDRYGEDFEKMVEAIG